MKFSDFLVAMLVMQHLQFAPLSWQMMQRYHSSKKAVSKKAQKGAVQKSARTKAEDSSTKGATVAQEEQLIT